MKKHGKDRLFEMMSKVDTSFRPKLNEEYYGSGDNDTYQEPTGSFNPEEHPETTENNEIPIKWTLPQTHPSWGYFDQNDILNANHAGFQSDWDINRAIEYAEHNLDNNSVRFLNHIKNLQQTGGLEENTLNESTSNSPINKFVYFGFNFPSTNFIDEVWSDDPNLAKHLKDKFMQYYDKYGSNAVMNMFYANLSSGNQSKLEDWIINNYSG